MRWRMSQVSQVGKCAAVLRCACCSPTAETSECCPGFASVGVNTTNKLTVVSSLRLTRVSITHTVLHAFTESQ